MDLGLFNELINKVKENNFIENFMKELSNHFENSERGVNNQMESNAQDLKESDFREEGVLYQVVDIGMDGVYLQNTKNDIVFEEKNISKELLNKLGNDYVLSYHDGEYVFEEQLTDDFFDSFIDIEEYEKIQNNFIEESNILDIAPDSQFEVISRKSEYSILKYGNEEDEIIEVPNELLPYFTYNDTILKYEDGKFEKI